jgi:hypothetical protein
MEGLGGGKRVRSAAAAREANISSGRFDPISGAIDYAIAAVNTRDVKVPSMLDINAGIFPDFAVIGSGPVLTKQGGSYQPIGSTSPSPQPEIAKLALQLPIAEQIVQAGAGMLGSLASGYALQKGGEKLGIGLPGGMYEAPWETGPWRVPDIPTQGRIQRWSTGTADFAVVHYPDGHKQHWVLGKDMIWKRYRPSKPIVIGKAATRKNRSKIMRALKRHNKTVKPIITSKTGAVYR